MKGVGELTWVVEDIDWGDIDYVHDWLLREKTIWKQSKWREKKDGMEIKQRRNSREYEKKIEWNVSNNMYIPLTAVTSKNKITPTNSFVKSGKDAGKKSKNS